jgi:hypothetical protein
MIRNISFGDSAGHLMEALLGHAGVDEVDSGTVLVRPEADDAVMQLLREAADGGWIVRLDGDDDTRIDTRLSAVPPEGLFGAPVDGSGEQLGPNVLRIWRSMRGLHIY